MISKKGTIFKSLYQLVQTQVDSMGKEPLTSCLASRKFAGNKENLTMKKRVHFAVSLHDMLLNSFHEKLA